MRKTVTALAMIAVALPATASAQVSLRDSVISRVIATYGVTFPVRNFLVQGTLHNHTRQIDGMMVRHIAGPREFRMGIHYPGETEVRMVRGNSAWRGYGHAEPQPVRGPLLSATLSQAVRTSLPWFLDEVRDSMTIEDDGAYLSLTMPVAEGVTLEAKIDTSTFFVVETISHVRMGPTEMTFRVTYSNFQRVSGILFPFHEETFAQGVHTATLEVAEIELNSDRTPEFFRPQT